MYGTKVPPIQTGEAYGAKNLDSYRSTAEFYDTFFRFEKKTFWSSGGGLKVRVTILKWGPEIVKITAKFTSLQSRIWEPHTA